MPPPVTNHRPVTTTPAPANRQSQAKSYRPAPDLDRVDRTPLRRDHQGQSVSDVQQLLRDAGYDLAVDGKFGPQTDRAVRDFQRTHGLEPDGLVGPRTLGQLRPTEAPDQVQNAQGQRDAQRSVGNDTAPTAPQAGAAVPDGAQSAGSLQQQQGVPVRVGGAPRPNPDAAPAPATTTPAPASPNPAPASDPTPAATNPPPAGEVDTAARDRLVEQTIARGVGGRDRAAFDLVERANMGAESGGRPVWSTAPTTAGYPAAYGQGQLNVTEHLGELRRLSGSQLESLGTSRAEVDQMRERAEATEGFFAVATRDDPRGSQLRSSGLNQEQARDLRQLVRDGDFDTAVERYEGAFQETSGITDQGAFRDMLESSVVQRPELRREFRDTFRQIHGRDFDPANRRNNEMAATVEAMRERHPELNRFAELTSNSSTGFYLGTANFNELAKGWGHRSAATVAGPDRTRELIENGAAVTTAQRHVRNFTRARRIVDAAGISGAERTRMIGRVARQYHGVPGTMTNNFMRDGEPRYTDEQSFRRAWDQHLSNPRRAAGDRSFTRNFDRLSGD